MLKPLIVQQHLHLTKHLAKQHLKYSSFHSLYSQSIIITKNYHQKTLNNSKHEKEIKEIKKRKRIFHSEAFDTPNVINDIHHQHSIKSSSLDHYHHGLIENVFPTTSTDTAIATTKKEEAHLIDGKAIAHEIKQEIKQTIDHIKDIQLKNGIKQQDLKIPGLAVILVGDRKDSATYVHMKSNACKEIGIENFQINLPETITEEELIKIIENCNENNKMDGILIQLPLPKHLNEELILQKVKMEKDVDGFHPYSFGRKINEGKEFIPCTPLGCLELLKRTSKNLNLNLEGKDAIVIGRSNIVGIPMAMLLLHQLNCSVEIVHKKSIDIPKKINQCDIIVSCCGQAGFIQPEWIKKGAIVIDVGANVIPNDKEERGYSIVGDVVCNKVLKERALAYTPVPGGVGPMTIAMLMRNTLQSFKAKHEELFVNCNN
ncbi:hypothetical protein ABK040_003748 [Willaertia magna]